MDSQGAGNLIPAPAECGLFGGVAMVRFLLWRLVQSVLVLWAIYTVTFFMLMIAPGDPFVAERKPNEIVREALAQKYGLDLLTKSAEERQRMSAGERFGYMCKAYGRYLGHALRGDLGPSLDYESFQVVDIIKVSLPVSMALGSAALILALWLGVAAGTLGALWKGRWGDIGLSVVTLLGVSLPTFVVGSLC